LGFDVDETAPILGRDDRAARGKWGRSLDFSKEATREHKSPLILANSTYQ
jgi:hypothetical protein